MQHQDDNLIQWKSKAWANPEMVAWYSKRMVEQSWSMMLKTRVEAQHIADWVCGRQVLDVGIGTGRGSIPLARAGYSVTGVDSSQAMLDETSRLAGGLQLDLRVGDVTKLPVDDNTTDFLLSLNVLVHFPHWRDVLSEWQRVVRPGGRVMFDIHSYDHLVAAHGAGASAVASRGMDSSEFGAYMSSVKVEDIVAWANDHGMVLRAIIPYSTLYSGACNNHLLTALESRHDWLRLCSWMASDRHLLDLAFWLEYTITARLPSAATYRYFVVLDNLADVAANQAWLDRNIRLQAMLSQGGDIAELANTMGLDIAVIHQQLARLLVNPRTRAYLYRIIKETGHLLPQLDFSALLPEPIAALYRDWALQDALDHAASRWSRECLSSGDGHFAFANTSLAPALEYPLVENILTSYFGVFSGVRS